MVGFRDFVGTDFAPVSNKTAVKKSLSPIFVLFNDFFFVKIRLIIDIEKWL